nr:MAG: nonstructural protein [Tarsiger cyanurus parvoviridae sp.]
MSDDELYEEVDSHVGYRKQKLNTEPRWYAAILGINEVEANREIDEEQASYYLRFSKNNKFYVPDRAKDEEITRYFWRFCNSANDWSDVYVAYHNGFTDTCKEFHGHHWHLLIHVVTDPTRDARWARSLQSMSKQTGKTYFTSRAVHTLRGYVRYITTPPRVEVGSKGRCDGTQWEEIIKEFEEKKAAREGMTRSMVPLGQGDTDSMGEDWSKTKLKVDPNFIKIQNLRALMNKYRLPDINQLRNRIKLTNKDDWRNFSLLLCSPSYDSVVKKATELFMTDEATMAFHDRMENYITSSEGTSDYMSLEESEKWFMDWCAHNDISPQAFLDDLFNVLTKSVPKKNTLMLEGGANGFKSFVVRSLIPFFMTWGEVHGSGNYQFMFQGCLDKALIICEEPMFEPATAEQAKQVLEGAPTQIQVKMKPPAILQPTPVLITSNNPLWKWCESARDAFKARMFHYKIKPWPLKKNQKLLINPAFWKQSYNEWYEGKMVEKTDEAIALVAASEECSTPITPREIPSTSAPKRKQPKRSLATKKKKLEYIDDEATVSGVDEEGGDEELDQ